MALTPGTRLGVHEIVDALGVGGMGEVYRARDTRLGREVAVKVLPDAFASDPDRLARFEREAKLLASLNHPHIAALYGMEEAAGQHFLVMELVEGETLADRLSRGPLPVKNALTLADQIAEALEAAHEKGIIHRDLKPANIKITPDEKVKVLDFGLAKLGPGGQGEARGAGRPGKDGMAQGVSPANLTHSPTLSMLATQAGVILGTAAYMSPEQAKGLPADHRSDVFSFGSVLYEMLSGRQPFQGDTAPDMLASVLAREADLTALPPNLNPRLVELLRRCLEKNPRRRWQAVGDLRAEIETVARTPYATPATASHVAPPHPLWRRAMPFLATAVVAGALAASSVWRFRPPAPPLTVTRFSLTLPEGEQFQAPAFSLAAISPDGTQLVYAANQRLYLRSMSELTSRVIAGTEKLSVFTGGPFFSPDGRSVAFWSGMDAATFTLKRIDVGGGVAVNICQTPTSFGGSWGPDGIVFGQAKGVMRVSPNGGQPELLVGVKSGEAVIGPQVLPGGKSVLFTLAKDVVGAGVVLGAERWDKAQVVVQSLTSGARKTLIDGGSDARYLPSGHLVYAVGSVVFAVPFDLKREEVAGSPVPVLEGVRRGVFASVESGVAQFSVSGTGSLVYVPAQAPVVSAQRNLVLVDRKGNVEALKLPPRPYDVLRISPDGKEVAYGTDDGRDANIWIYGLAGASSPRQLTFAGRNRFPIWTPDGQRIAFQSDRGGDLSIFWQRADGTTEAERLTKPEPGAARFPRSWSPDGKTLLFESAKGFMRSLSLFSIQDGKMASLAEAVTSVEPIGGMFSPDGRWVAYMQPNDRAFPQVFVQPFPSTGAKYLIAYGRHSVWSPDGKELFVEQLGPNGQFQLTSVRVTPQPVFAVGNPVPVSGGSLQFGLERLERHYDITPDGQRFIGVVDAAPKQGGTAAAPQIHIVLNWFEELKQRVPSGK